jgi:hypothetical protein
MVLKPTEHGWLEIGAKQQFTNDRRVLQDALDHLAVLTHPLDVVSHHKTVFTLRKPISPHDLVAIIHTGGRNSPMSCLVSEELELAPMPDWRSSLADYIRTEALVNVLTSMA